MRLTVSSHAELEQTLAYIRAMRDMQTLPEVKAGEPVSLPTERVKPAASIDSFPTPKPVAPRREAIPRAVHREVWQRDGGQCVECGTREKLCYDQLVPFSRGGSNTVRNVQILCECCMPGVNYSERRSR